MKIIYIHGSPAVGKLTVAEELEKLLGYKIFHNHLSTNIARILYKIGSEKFRELKWKICEEFFEAAYKENVSFVYTVCYSGETSDSFIKKMIKKYPNEMCFVQLYCNEETLLSRVNSESRKKHNKIISQDRLKETIHKHGIDKPIEYVNSLKIDNSNIPAKKVALMIKEHYW